MRLLRAKILPSKLGKYRWKDWVYIHEEVLFPILNPSIRQRDLSVTDPCEHCTAKVRVGTEPGMPSSSSQIHQRKSLHLPWAH